MTETLMKFKSWEFKKSEHERSQDVWQVFAGSGAACDVILVSQQKNICGDSENGLILFLNATNFVNNVYKECIREKSEIQTELSDWRHAGVTSLTYCMRIMRRGSPTGSMALLIESEWEKVTGRETMIFVLVAKNFHALELELNQFLLLSRTHSYFNCRVLCNIIMNNLFWIYVVL